MINIAMYIPRSMICGPGKRFVIWVQGCRRRCEGCGNTEMQPFKTKTLISTSDLFNLIISEPDLEGITLLGGEPLHQSKELLSLVKKIKDIGLTVMLYTGYEIDEIKDPDAIELVNYSDIIIPGRFVSEKKNLQLKWRGSSNQKVIFNNNKYKKIYSKLGEENQVEIHIDDNGNIHILGYPDKELIEGVLYDEKL